MTEPYLNPRKSFIISSPAGSGKTEKLARRYISLLDSGAEPQRVLSITFTERAASEMKERILRIISSENPSLYRRIRPQIPLMRISTIHAFCLRLLRRFSVELGLDPNLSVMDEGLSSSLWQDCVAAALRAEAENHGPFFEMMRRRGIRGWDGLLSHLDEVFRARPISELMLEETLDAGGQSGRELLTLFARCLDIYRQRKLEARSLDFSDLELMAWRALFKSPDWQSILYSFDEHTDHLLVDEFQDTSALQWRIIDKLTEEWRSGLGAKRDSGTVPTIFLVGDEKQSIYLFRGADVSVVRKARQRLADFLGEEYEFHEVKDNYRSLPEIVDFANCLFEKLMPRAGDGQESPAKTCDYRVGYSPFEARRQGRGKVELLLLSPDEGARTKENRVREARVLARHIKTLYRKHEVHDPDTRALRRCSYADMAVLLRQRTHLASFEDALRKEDIPFVVLKGVGFFDEPEVALLREFVCFAVDPTDDYSLFCLLRSPLFGVGYEALLRLRNGEGSLFDRLREASTRNGQIRKAAALLGELTDQARRRPLSMVLEQFLESSAGWSALWERQRHANVKKFISMIEEMEADGANPIAVRDRLLLDRHKEDVPKANVNAEGMDAVRLLTIHAAKGLQFPMVFLPCLDEGVGPKSPAVIIEEGPKGLAFRYEPEAALRKLVPEFERRKEREVEEEKRLFYVAVTRAMDYLFLSGFDSKNPKGRLAYLKEAFDIGAAGHFSLISEREIEERYSAGPGITLAEERHFLDEPVFTEPLGYEPALNIRDVTEDILVKTRHGKDWVLIGRLVHQVLEEISTGVLPEENAEERAALLVAGSVFEPERREKFLRIITGDIAKLRKNGIMEDIVNPRDMSYAELPFVHERGKTLFRGRIDRLILKDGTALIYDYKSFPVKRDSEMAELVEKYRFQMELYREAAAKLFSLPARAFLVFTHLPLCVEI